MPRIPILQLTNFGARIFTAAGAPPEIAQRVSDSLVRADTFGVYSHGIQLLTGYVQRIKEGSIKPAALPITIKETAVTALVDGQFAFGHIVAARAMQLAIEKAKAGGIAIVCANHCNHVGRVGEYPEMAAHVGLIGLAFVNATKIVAPFGGRARMLSTNPIAFSVPVPGERPLLVDFATSSVAANKLRLASNRGAKIPRGWILDKEGAETDNPNDFFDGGFLVPFGDHNGYGLSIMIEILGGLLSGSGSAMFGDFPMGGNGLFVMAISPEFFRPSEEFLADVRRMIEMLRATPPLDGVEAVMVPGDPETKAEMSARRDGIEIDDVTWKLILDAGRSVGVEYVASD